MKSPLGHVRKLTLGVCNSWYGRSILYFSQNAALEKKGPKWHNETSSPSVAAAEKAISEHVWQIKNSKTNFLYLLDASAAKKFACLVAADRPPNSTAYTIEMNAGLGVLARELLEAGIPSIEMYEEVEYFWPRLTALKDRYPDRLSLKEVNFSHVMNLGYWDWREDTKELDAYLDKVATRSHQEEPPIEIIGSLGNANFVKFLVGCFVFQNSLSKYGRIRLYVAVPPSVSAQATCDNKHYGIYRTWVVMFQTLFRCEHLGDLPRFAFYPKHKKTKAVRVKCLRKIREHDDRIMHVVKIESRADVFNEEFKKSDLVTFYYFVHHHLRARTTKIIPALEHWIPGYGRSLIADGYTIFTEFGELMPDELLRLFIKFKSSPGFLKSSFVSCMSSFFLKMEEHFVFDDTAENIDEMFQSRMEEYVEKQKTKDEWAK